MIVGIGETEYSRGTNRSSADLVVEAALQACKDASVSPNQIDGIILAGREGKVEDLSAALNMSDVRWTGRVELGGASSVAGLSQAATVVQAGVARKVLVVAARLGFSKMRLSGGDPNVMAEVARALPGTAIRTDLEQPYGLFVPMQYYALQATRWFHDYSISADALAPVALATRYHANMSTRALMRERVLTRSDYLDSPVICSPFRLYDCCLETDGAAAVIVASVDPHAGDRPSVEVRAAAEGHPTPADDIVTRPDLIEIGLKRAADVAFNKASLGPEDMHFAEIYDCFTYMVMRQIEELGFCQRGESPAFVERVGIRVGEGLPINTHGGLLSQAHVLGMNHIVEAVLQLRGQSEAQVSGAGVGLVTGYGDFGDSSIAILARIDS